MLLQFASDDVCVQVVVDSVQSGLTSHLGLLFLE